MQAVPTFGVRDTCGDIERGMIYKAWRSEECRTFGREGSALFFCGTQPVSCTQKKPGDISPGLFSE